jgi:hypothetical protein
MKHLKNALDYLMQKARYYHPDSAEYLAIEDAIAILFKLSRTA